MFVGFTRYLNFEEERKNLYETRWPPSYRFCKNFKSKSFTESAKGKEVECESANDDNKCTGKHICKVAWTKHQSLLYSHLLMLEFVKLNF
ncbi:hypothetical protein P3L10_032965 [Capsicum annuum]